MAAGGAMASLQVLPGCLRGEPAPSRPHAQDAAARAADRGPIIDVHLHAYPADAAFSPSLGNPANGRPPGVANGEEHLKVCLAEMKRLGIVRGVVSGGDGDRLGAAMHWHDADPERIIAAAGVRGSEEIPMPELGILRKAFSERKLRVLGEVTAQYAGRSLSDPLYEPYLALAEELDIPVSVHMGLGGPGVSYDPCCRGFRAALGNPFVLEECLNRHPKMRLNVMHGGWPYLQETMAVLQLYPQVFTDVAALNWISPRAEFYAYFEALIRAGYSKRILYGTDQMYWPEVISLAVETVDAAPFLTPEHKRDIFYNNAVRFLKLPDRA
jgi:predicted TIM-barrel fold metal-dependent hydrolase